eukprot:c5217_g1_i1 orf=506-730(-)
MFEIKHLHAGVLKLFQAAGGRSCYMLPMCLVNLRRLWRVVPSFLEPPSHCVHDVPLESTLTSCISLLSLTSHAS